MNDPTAFLLWVRGPALDFSIAVFVLGIFVRLLEIFMLGRKPSFAEPRGGEWGPGLRTMVTRSLADSGTFQRSGFNVIVGWIWHVGFLVVLFLFVPHIELFGSVLGLTWAGLPNPLIDAAAAVTAAAMIAMLIHRLRHPVMRFLSGVEDYLTWTAVFLPVLTGYLAYHRLINPYPLALGLHVLTVEVLLILFPFTKLMHAFTGFIARWYNGAMAGRKGVES